MTPGMRIEPFSPVANQYFSPPLEPKAKQQIEVHAVITNNDNPLQVKRTIYRSAEESSMKRIAGLLLVLGMSQAYAHSDKQPVPAGSKWKEECSSCHVAYPPELLAADNWQTLMGGLSKHFGANASLNAKDNKTILDYLLSHSNNAKQNAAESLRISDTPWFRQRHRSIAPAEWTNPSVRSRSNCNGCHGKTVLGDGY